METERDLLSIILEHMDTDMYQTAQDCVAALQIMLGGAEAVMLDEDASGEISTLVIGTIHATETMMDWAIEHEIEYDYIEGLTEETLEDLH